jgi:CcmD family protein
MLMKKSLLLLAVLAVLAAATAFAQQPGPPASAQGEFVPVNALPPQAEQLPAAPMVMAAYAFVWVAVLFYVWSLWKRMRRLEDELAGLQRRIEKR